MDLVPKCSVERLPGLLHFCIDGELGLLQPANEKHSSYWLLEEWFEVKKSVLRFFYDSVKFNRTTEQCNNALLALPDPYKNIFLDVLDIRKNDLMQKLLNETNAIAACPLKNFDWEVKLSLSSDKLASMNEPLLGLTFDTHDGCGKSKIFHCELNKNELAQMINSFDNAYKALMNVKM